MIKRRDPRFNITDKNQNTYVVHLVVIRNLDTGRYWSESKQDWFTMPNENISVWANKERAKATYLWLAKKGYDVTIREMDYQESIPDHKYLNVRD